MTAMMPTKRTPETERSERLRWMDHIFHAMITIRGGGFINVFTLCGEVEKKHTRTKEIERECDGIKVFNT